MRATHLQAEEYYSQIRETAPATTMKNLSHLPGLDLRLITAAALQQAKLWEAEPARQVDWNWFAGYSAFRFRHPKRFEMAIWHQSRLIGMSLGRPTYHGGRMRLDFLEAAPYPDAKRIKIFPIAFAAVVIYAKALAANEIRLMNPINETVRGYYERFGFRYVDKQDYLYINLAETQI